MAYRYHYFRSSSVLWLFVCFWISQVSLSEYNLSTSRTTSSSSAELIFDLPIIDEDSSSGDEENVFLEFENTQTQFLISPFNSIFTLESENVPTNKALIQSEPELDLEKFHTRHKRNTENGSSPPIKLQILQPPHPPPVMPQDFSEQLNSVLIEFQQSNSNSVSITRGQSQSSVWASKSCRHYNYLPVPIFQLQTCASCYIFMQNIPILFGNPSKKWSAMNRIFYPTSGLGLPEKFVIAIFTNGNETSVANVSDTRSGLFDSFANGDSRMKWVDCCKSAERCCEKMLTEINHSNFSTSTKEGDSLKCLSTWDSWQCWDSTPAQTTARAPCPYYIYANMDPSCTTLSEKNCMPDGTWQKLKGKEWTNYSMCASGVVSLLKRRDKTLVMAYAISIIAIIPALVIFFAYKQLRVHRTILHKHLLISLLMNGLFVVSFKIIVIGNQLESEGKGGYINENGIGCRLLFILTKYSRLTNYMWMFAEGFYLHKLIAAAFAEQKSLNIFFLIGWVFPIIPTCAYAILRILYANDRCWVLPHESFEWILNGPSLLSLLINMLFLINIIRVLVTKLRAAPAPQLASSNVHEPSHYRKAVRATLVLLPLFGLHFWYIFRIFKILMIGHWIELYYNINYILDGLQGFLVALIFCYLNGEVLSLLKRTYKRFSETYSGGSCGRKTGANQKSRRDLRGKSVISTQYTSVPPSPEPGSVTRLTPIMGEDEETLSQNSKKFANLNGKSTNNLLTVDNPAIVNQVSIIQQQQSGDDDGLGTSCRTSGEFDGQWTEISLKVNDQKGNESIELKSNSQKILNGDKNSNVKAEHQV